MIKSAGAAGALRKLVHGEPVTVEDEAVFGRLNSWCVQMWYEPMVVLIKRPQVSPGVRALLESTKALRGDDA